MNRAELTAHFKASRDKLIGYVDKTSDDLRSHRKTGKPGTARMFPVYFYANFQPLWT
jgi:hypothetical protein